VCLVDRERRGLWLIEGHNVVASLLPGGGASGRLAVWLSMSLIVWVSGCLILRLSEYLCVMMQSGLQERGLCHCASGNMDQVDDWEAV